MNISSRVVIPLVAAGFLVVGLSLNQALHFLGTGVFGTTYRIVLEQTDGGAFYRAECARWYQTSFSFSKRFPIMFDESAFADDREHSYFLALEHMDRLVELRCKAPGTKVIKQIP